MFAVNVLRALYAHILMHIKALPQSKDMSIELNAKHFSSAKQAIKVIFKCVGAMRLKRFHIES